MAGWDLLFLCFRTFSGSTKVTESSFALGWGDLDFRLVFGLSGSCYFDVSGRISGILFSSVLILVFL